MNHYLHMVTWVVGSKGLALLQILGGRGPAVAVSKCTRSVYVLHRTEPHTKLLRRMPHCCRSRIRHIQQMGWGS